MIPSSLLFVCFITHILCMCLVSKCMASYAYQWNCVGNRKTAWFGSGPEPLRKTDSFRNNIPKLRPKANKFAREPANREQEKEGL